MINILGAGMAGLIAAQMLRRFQPLVFEKQDKLPDNHAALLRFRSDAVSRVTGIPFRKVMVQKAIMWDGKLINHVPIAAANQYAWKVSETYKQRSIWNLAPEARWIAPPDFLTLLAKGVNISFSSGMTSIEHDVKSNIPIISTIPMPIMAKELLHLEKVPEFKTRAISVFSLNLNFPETDLYQTIYYPGEFFFPYRASITGSRLIIEMIEKNETPYTYDPVWIQKLIRDVLNDFGLHAAAFMMKDVNHTTQKFGKIIPTDEKWRKEFISELTRRQNIYSLGRFATWRQILLDDVVQDVEQIERFIAGGSDYARSLHSYKG